MALVRSSLNAEFVTGSTITQQAMYDVFDYVDAGDSNAVSTAAQNAAQVEPVISVSTYGVQVSCIQNNSVYNFWGGPCASTVSIGANSKIQIADTTGFPMLLNYQGPTIYAPVRILDPTGTSIFSTTNEYVSVDATGIYLCNGGTTAFSGTAGNIVSFVCPLILN